VVDSGGRIVEGGTALSSIAQFSAVYAPQQKFDLDPRLVRHALVDLDCWRTNAVVDRNKIDLCLGAVGGTRYVIPRFVPTDGGRQLVVEIHENRARGPKVVTHEVAESELNLVPGLIALDALEHFGAAASLSDEGRAWVAAPQFQTLAEACDFADSVPFAKRDATSWRAFGERLLTRNPGWVAAWDFYLDSGTDRPAFHQEQPKADEVRSCGTVARSQAQRALFESRGAVALKALLELAPAQRGQALYHQLLVLCAQSLKDDELYEQLLPRASFGERRCCNGPGRRVAADGPLR
jgi:hypothetical protein